MDTIVERYYKDVLFFCGTADEMKALLRKICSSAAEEGRSSMIKFFARRHHKRTLSEKVDVDVSYKRFMYEVDEITYQMAQYWKALDAKYRYFYKDIRRV